VDERYARGPIIGQWPVPVLEDDAPEDVAARVLAVEHRVLPAVVEAIAEERVTLGEDGWLRWRGERWFPAERFCMAGGAGPGEPADRR
jgi:folate-dependent phosphoribosylglycinamide formyltransferase PurN